MQGESLYLEQLCMAIGIGKGERDIPSFTGQPIPDAVAHLSAIQGTTVLTTTDKTILARAMMRQQQQLLTLDKVWKALEKDNIRPVLLKGLSLAKNYPEPYRRVSSDVDIWVGKGQFDKVAAVLEGELDVVWHHENETVNERHYNFDTKQCLVFEIHPQTIPFILPAEKAALEALERPAMEQSEEFVFEGHTFRMPQANFNFLFVFMHAWEHFISTGIGMKHLADLAVLLKDPQLSQSDPNTLNSQLSTLNLYEPWLVTGYVVVKAFGLNKEQWPGYDDSRKIRRLGKRLYKRIMKEGLTRPRTQDKARPIHNKWISKIVTLCNRVRTAMMIAPYSPQYARHYLYCALYRGFSKLRTPCESGSGK